MSPLITRYTAFSFPGMSDDARIDRVPGADGDPVVAVRDPGEGRHRLALRARAHEHDLVVRQRVHPLLVDEHALGHGEVAEVGRDRHVADHRPADQRDPAAVRGGGVEHLLDAVDVGREGRDDHAPLGGREDGVEHGADLPLVGREAGDLGVRGVDHEQVDAGLAEPGERTQVGDPAVERQLVHLEVAGVQHGPGRGAHGDRERVRDGVVDRDELALEHAEPLGHALPHGERQRGDAVLAELGLDERERQLRADQRDVAAQAQQVRDRADVVLVAVREDDRLDVVEPVGDVVEVRQDEVDAGLVVLGEQHAAVDDEQAAGVLEHRHVAADLPQPAERDDAQGALRAGRAAGRAR